MDISVYTNWHMLQVDDDTKNTVVSARELRTGLRLSQTNDAQLRVLYQMGQSIFNQGWANDSIQQTLLALCTHLGMQHGLIATETSGKLTLMATKGQTLPIGARVPLLGMLASLLKSPVQFRVVESQGTRLWTYVDNGEWHEWLIPIAINQKSIGLIALSGKTAQIASDDIGLLHTMSGLLSIALKQAEYRYSPITDRAILECLTPREREIFALMPAGLSNPALAKQLGIAAGTVKIHVERILSKLNLKDRTQAAVKAVEMGYKS